MNHYSNLHTRQLALEAEMETAGIERYERQILEATTDRPRSENKSGRKGSPTTGTPAAVLLDHAYLKVKSAFAEVVKNATAGKAGRRVRALEVLEDGILKPQVCAYIGLKITLDTIPKQPEVPLTSLAVAIGRALETEWKISSYVDMNKEAVQPLIRKVVKKGGTTENYRKASVSATVCRMVKEGVEGLEVLPGWPLERRHQLGLKIIEVIEEHTGLIESEEVTRGKNNSLWVVRKSSAAAEWWTKAIAAGAAKALPVFLPMIHPPADWTSPFNGGYLSVRRGSRDLVRSANAVSRRAVREVPVEQIDAVLKACNAVQATGWSINQAILDVQRNLWEASSQLPCLPPRDDLEIPIRPPEVNPDVAFKDLSPEHKALVKEWKHEATKVHDKNHRLLIKRNTWTRILSLAEKFKGEDSIYFPVYLDYRGRMYPKPDALHYQGSDQARGLLQLSSSVPITTPEALFWFQVYGASLFGLDKETFETRLKWVEDNHERILKTAEDPYSDFWWAEADGGDSAWRFLAWCFDWAGFDREGWGYQSHLYIALDGTCNGLQHFSAMLRDPVGGSSVNLINASDDKPRDIYAEVAEMVRARIEADMENPADEATYQQACAWSGRISRSVCKRPVMTTVYGATPVGFVDQIFEDTVLPLSYAEPDCAIAKDRIGSARYLGKILWEICGDALPAARRAMDWIREVSKVLAQNQLELRWTSPVGLPVAQAYRKRKVEKIDTVFRKVRVRLSLAAPEGSNTEDPIALNEQVAGSAPNFVHSIDAAHMMMTINACRELGVESFAVVHDSFGTHAGNTGVLAAVLREQFVALYQGNDPLAALYEEACRAVDPLNADRPVEDRIVIPQPPEKGDLKIQEVLDSTFFFSC